MAESRVPRVTYNHVRSCFKCGSSWSGYGNICNACRTIDTLEKQAKSSVSVNPTSIDSNIEYNVELALARPSKKRLIDRNYSFGGSGSGSIPQVSKKKKRLEEIEAHKKKLSESNSKTVNKLVEIFLIFFVLYLCYVFLTPLGKFLGFIYYISFGWWIELFMS